MTTVLLLHPGQMGASIGAALVDRDIDVLWVREDRSQATYQRASEHGFRAIETLSEALSLADFVVSVCPPEFAISVAQGVADTGFDGVFVDANAVSPATSSTIATRFADQYVDGGIIGPPARRRGTTRLYLSGARAALVGDLFEDSLVEAIVCGQTPGAASAVKMAFAAYTKGSSALLMSIAALAEHYQVTDTVLSEWSLSLPNLEAMSQGAAQRTSAKAWRFVSEMKEIEQTFVSAGLPGGFHAAAADIYARLNDFKNDPQPLDTVVSQLLKPK